MIRYSSEKKIDFILSLIELTINQFEVVNLFNIIHTVIINYHVLIDLGYIDNISASIPGEWRNHIHNVIICITYVSAGVHWIVLSSVEKRSHFYVYRGQQLHIRLKRTWNNWLISNFIVTCFSNQQNYFKRSRRISPEELIINSGTVRYTRVFVGNAMASDRNWSLDQIARSRSVVVARCEQWSIRTGGSCTRTGRVVIGQKSISRYWTGRLLFTRVRPFRGVHVVTVGGKETCAEVHLWKKKEKEWEWTNEKGNIKEVRDEGWTWSSICNRRQWTSLLCCCRYVLAVCMYFCLNWCVRNVCVSCHVHFHRSDTAACPKFLACLVKNKTRYLLLVVICTYYLTF